jgi:dolichyl-phosphate-mannose-protein mannosyltransferase
MAGLHESLSVPDHSASRIFLAAHFALLAGGTTPQKLYFDEVHDVPAARQMLEPIMPAPMLSPMRLVDGNIGGRSWRRA